MATTDSHFSTSIIKSKKSELIKKDFRTFKNCKSIFAMTAHIIYKAYDSTCAATHSKIIIKDVIRKHIGFKDGTNAIFINEKNYKERFEDYLSDTDNTKWQEIAAAGRKHALEQFNNDKATESLVELMHELV